MESLITDFEKLSSIIATTYAGVALIMTIVLSLVPKRDLSVKLLGSLMVLSIMFGANNAWIYAIGVFIVATLVTELQFLEKLAALAWNRKEYWQYLISGASDEEIEAKRIQEVAEIESSGDKNLVSPTSNKTSSDNDSISIRQKIFQEAKEFEQNVLEALEKNKKQLFNAHRLKQQVKLRGRAGLSILDAIAESEQSHYLIEIKYFRHRSIVRRAIHQVRGLTYSYSDYLTERNIDVHVYPILVVPEDLIEESLVENVPLLKFDTEKMAFSNIHDFIKAIELVSKADT